MKKIFLILCTLLFSNVVAAKKNTQAVQMLRHKKPAITELSLIEGAEVKKLSTEDLLKNPATVEITVKSDPAYEGKPKTYKAIPISILFKEIKFAQEDSVVFKCKDGYSGPLSLAKITSLAETDSKAYLAIEDPKAPWELLAKKMDTPGPFYLIWDNPDKSKISPEEWPFQITSFEFLPSTEKLFPNIVPKSTDAAVLSGYKLFTQNCFACHRIDGAGYAEFGPDLNKPMNPTAYMTEEGLKKLIKDSATVRTWPGKKMPAFPHLSDGDINSLIRYFTYRGEANLTTRGDSKTESKVETKETK